MRKLLLLALLLPSLAFAQYGGLWNSPHRYNAISGGAIDGSIIGATTPAAGTFTSLAAGQPALSNDYFGSGAGNLTASGGSNAGFGKNVFSALTTGNNNGCFGPYACSSATSMQRSTAVGNLALANATDASYNTAIGDVVLYSAEGANSVVRYNACGGYQACIGDYGVTGVFVTWSTGDSNAVWGAKAMRYYTTASKNALNGAFAGEHFTTATHNACDGYQCLGSLTDGNSNVTHGSNTLWQSTGASNTVAIGRDSGYSVTRSIVGSVFAGFRSGYYETADNTLMIDNQQRSSEADARVKALVYGIFASTTSAQRVRFNAAMEYAVITDPATAPGATLAGERWICGTNAGTAKKVAYAGTSTTPSTIIDNVGSGVTGC